MKTSTEVLKKLNQIDKTIDAIEEKEDFLQVKKLELVRLYAQRNILIWILNK